MHILIPTPGRKPISSFDKLDMRISGMRGTREYEAERIGDEARLRCFSLVYAGGEEPRRLDAEVAVSAREVVDALSAAHAEKWDGFHGQHPRGVLDGEMFELSIYADDERVVHADGSANFPKGFQDFRGWLDGKLREVG